MNRCSLREIARRWNVEPSYVSKFLRNAGITAGPDCKYDFALATRAREEQTLVGTGTRRKRIEQAKAVTRASRTASPTLAPGVRHCDGCGGLYLPAGLECVDCGGDERFCSDDCREWFGSGLSQQEIRRKRCDEFVDQQVFTKTELRKFSSLVFDWVTADGRPLIL